MGSVKSIEMDNEVHLTWVFTSAQNSWLFQHIPQRYFMKMLIENLEKRNLEPNGFSLLTYLQQDLTLTCLNLYLITLALNQRQCMFPLNLGQT